MSYGEREGPVQPLGLGLDWNPPSSNVNDFLVAMGLLADGGGACGRELSEERVYPMGAVETGLSEGREYAMGTMDIGLSEGRMAELEMGATADKGGG